MQIGLTLLAPARNAEIGIAAIDCGADAVYIAGPAFGARAAAGNEVSDIARLCRYAHLFGVKIHATVNTLLQDDELADARRLMWELYEAGVDVFIIQDLNLLSLDLPPVELHASTQTAIRTPERAKELASLGFSRLVLERQLTLEQIRAIRAAVPEQCGLEFFIHGALCVGYSGQCYLSQYLTGRSANRGACAQVCRSRYDLADADGHILVQDRTLLSPKDIRFDGRVADLVAAGITSFKIEGRLKNVSYVKNVVRHYRRVLDAFISTGRHYVRASAGRLEGGFTPDPARTFGRGWTEAFLDDRTEQLASEDAAKSMGEYIGEIAAVKGRDVVIRTTRSLANGDGLSFVSRSDEVSGGRVEVAAGNRVTLRDTAALSPGMRVYRNFDICFERELENNMPKRVIDVSVSWQSMGGETFVSAVTEDGIRAEKRFADNAPVAEKPEAALENLRRQLGKHSGPFAFAVQAVEADPVRFYPAAFLNGIRRELAAALQERAENRPRQAVPHTPRPQAGALNRSTLDIPGELLRSRYCIRWELGLCPKRCPVKPGMTRSVTPGLTGGPGPLYLVNQKNRLRLQFDCARCEMVVLPS
ncbi:MAG: U32 family peptidase [Bacteroidales bacterium]|nr:U32 family peptidase [Bacteroidales bacterium]